MAYQRKRCDPGECGRAHWEARIAELEAALAPFANLLLSLTTDEIEPKAMLEVSRPDGDDCDLLGADIIRARKALNK